MTREDCNRELEGDTNGSLLTLCCGQEEGKWTQNSVPGSSALWNTSSGVSDVKEENSEEEPGSSALKYSSGTWGSMATGGSTSGATTTGESSSDPLEVT